MKIHPRDTHYLLFGGKASLRWNSSYIVYGDGLETGTDDGQCNSFQNIPAKHERLTRALGGSEFLNSLQK